MSKTGNQNQKIRSISKWLPKNNIELNLNFNDKKGIKKVDGLTLAATSFILISLTSLSLSIHPTIVGQNPQTLGETTDVSYVQKKKFWGDYLKENPRYIDGWLELTRIEYEMGNMIEAKKALDQAKRINPNLTKVQKVETELGI